MIALLIILSVALAISVFLNFYFFRYVKAFKSVVAEYKKQKRKAEFMSGFALTMTAINFFFAYKLNNSKNV